MHILLHNYTKVCQFNMSLWVVEISISNNLSAFRGNFVAYNLHTTEER